MNAYAQISIARINIYFGKDSYTIAEEMARKLYALIHSTKSWEIEKIYLHG
ncbi:hypothetical protein N9I68_00920 [Bacteroidia bacterium]|nr:hypothetical protein [Bacteroidia bacterium]MDB4107676.1 hypothetical protein [Bacteroidia bacterium]